MPPKGASPPKGKPSAAEVALANAAATGAIRPVTKIMLLAKGVVVKPSHPTPQPAAPASASPAKKAAAPSAKATSAGAKGTKAAPPAPKPAAKKGSPAKKGSSSSSPSTKREREDDSNDAEIEAADEQKISVEASGAKKTRAECAPATAKRVGSLPVAVKGEKHDDDDDNQIALSAGGHGGLLGATPLTPIQAPPTHPGSSSAKKGPLGKDSPSSARSASKPRVMAPSGSAADEDDDAPKTAVDEDRKIVDMTQFASVGLTSEATAASKTKLVAKAEKVDDGDTAIGPTTTTNASAKSAKAAQKELETKEKLAARQAKQKEADGAKAAKEAEKKAKADAKEAEKQAKEAAKQSKKDAGEAAKKAAADEKKKADEAKKAAKQLAKLEAKKEALEAEAEDDDEDDDSDATADITGGDDDSDDDDVPLAKAAGTKGKKGSSAANPTKKGATNKNTTVRRAKCELCDLFNTEWEFCGKTGKRHIELASPAVVAPTDNTEAVKAEAES